MEFRKRRSIWTGKKHTHIVSAKKAEQIDKKNTGCAVLFALLLCFVGWGLIELFDLMDQGLDKIFDLFK